MFPMVLVSNGVYDTGMIGSVIIGPGGSIVVYRDLDDAPSDFDGDPGGTTE